MYEQGIIEGVTEDLTVYVPFPSVCDSLVSFFYCSTAAAVVMPAIETFLRDLGMVTGEFQRPKNIFYFLLVFQLPYLIYPKQP